MAKIITENFRVANSKEFIKSFDEINGSTADSIRNSVRDYLIRTGLVRDEGGETLSDLNQTQKDAVSQIVLEELNELKPENDLYLFASSVDQNEDETISNTQVEKRKFLERVIFGRKISKVDTRHMFTKNDWIPNRVYDSFDDTGEVENVNTYVTVLDGGEFGESSYKVFKCLSNNNNSPSTQEPRIASNASDFTPFTLSDNYIWKYMFTVPAVDYIAFGTTTDLPYVPDERVIQQAEEAVYSVVIERTPADLFGTPSEGLNLGSCRVLSATAVRDPVNDVQTFRVEIRAETPGRLVRTESNAYTNMYIRVLDPETEDTTIFDIVSSAPVQGDASRFYAFIQVRAYSDGSYPNVKNGLETNGGKLVEIAPKIEVSRSTGEDAIAYGVLSSSGELRSVQFIKYGTQYKSAEAKLLLPPSKEDRNLETTLRVISPPIGGHGADPVLELFMSKVAVVANFINSAATPIPTSNTYTKVGLVKNPKFSSAEKVFPSVFDNRVKFDIESDATDQIAVNQLIEQVVDLGNGQSERIYGRAHEITYNEETGLTQVCLVDYVGNWQSEFRDGQINIIRESTDSSVDNIVVDTFSINNVKTNQIEKTLTDGTPSGTFEDNGYVAYTGEVLHFIDFDPITRTENRKEKIKLVFDF